MDPVDPDVRSSRGPEPVRLTGKDAFWLHVTLIAGLLLCIGAFVIELWRALDGHAFSWMYVFEWPIFATFAIYMWWNLLHGHDRVPRPPVRRGSEHAPSFPAEGAAPVSATGAPADEQLAAWNRYLHDLERTDEATRPRAGSDPAQGPLDAR